MGEHAFLELLLADAPAEAFDEPLDAARRRGAPPEELERLQEAAVLALQLRGVLTQRRRREHELAALYETAGDLTSIRDVDRVVRAIVQRARRLLRTDTAYLAMIDPERGDAPIEFTEGTVGEEFRRLRLPLGVGLGGLVAATAQPSFTSDYLHDERFVHTGVIDHAVGMERIVAILGVPLLVGERAIGVLFAADRTPRQWPPDDVQLLVSLAAHAALAIENARLFQQNERALAELEEANTYVREHSRAVERAAAVHERLADVVLGGGDLADVAAPLAEVLDGAVVVLGSGDEELVRAGPSSGLPEPPRLPGRAQLRKALAEARGTGRAVGVEVGGDEGRAWVVAVVAGAERLGALVLCGQRDLSGADLRTLERAAQVTALLLLQQRSVATAEQRLRGEFFEDVLAHARRDPEGLRRRATLLGLALDAPHVVVSASGGDRAALLSAATRATTPRGLVAERGPALVLLVPAADGPAPDVRSAARHAQPGPDAPSGTLPVRGVAEPPAGGQPGVGAAAVAGRVAAVLRAAGTVTVGAAGPAAGAAALAAAWVEAERCRRVLVALGRDGEAATADDLGVYALLFSEAGRAELERFVERMLGPLLAYDAERGSALVDTLQAWFAQGRNHTRTAEALHVHVNTLYQRLDRIGALLDRPWQDAEVGLQLHLALTIRRLAALDQGG